MTIAIAELDLDEIQARILKGEVLSPAEYRSVIEKYRGERKAASAASPKSKAKAAAKPSFDLNADLDAVFGSLEKKGE